ncbi:MAG: aldo/keto reductase, partial [Anaerolineae bacterium]|nr:aldo/keto reductase [Anaerolineae bacterium]
VDIVHIHDPQREHYQQVMDEAFPLLDDMRRQGVISAIGAGMNTWDILVDFIRDAAFDCFLLAGRYTLLEQGALEFYNQMHAQGVSIFAAGIYNTGILAKGAIEGAWYQYAAAPPEIVERVRRIETVCAATMCRSTPPPCSLFGHTRRLRRWSSAWSRRNKSTPICTRCKRRFPAFSGMTCARPA